MPQSVPRSKRALVVPIPLILPGGLQLCAGHVSCPSRHDDRRRVPLFEHDRPPPSIAGAVQRHRPGSSPRGHVTFLHKSSRILPIAARASLPSPTRSLRVHAGRPVQRCTRQLAPSITSIIPPSRAHRPRISIAGRSPLHSTGLGRGADDPFTASNPGTRVVVHDMPHRNTPR
jgi:hypothetical protein